jgi:hypothetical protein
LGGRGRRISEFKASLGYRVSSRTARATQRNPISKKKKKKERKTVRESIISIPEKTRSMGVNVSLIKCLCQNTDG